MRESEIVSEVWNRARISRAERFSGVKPSPNGSLGMIAAWRFWHSGRMRAVVAQPAVDQRDRPLSNAPCPRRAGPVAVE